MPYEFFTGTQQVPVTLQQQVDVLLQAGRVRRMHTVPTIGDGYTVGGHSWSVAMLALLLIPDRALGSRVALAALTHDVAEVLTGDVPATLKWLSPEVAQHLDAVEDRFRARFRVPDAGLTEAEHDWLHLLDIVELSLYARHQMTLGNRSDAITEVDRRCQEAITHRAQRVEQGDVVWTLFQ